MGMFRRAAESFLPDRDYLPLAMPTTDLSLLHVLTHSGGALHRYTVIDSLLSQPPAVTYTTVTDAPVADAQGTGIRKAKAGIGLGIVGGLAEALGAGAKLDLSASGAHTVEYAYTGVTADRVDVVTLDRWLAGCDLDPAQRNVAELLVAQQLFVVVAVLKARGLKVTLLDESEHDIAVDLPAVQQMVKGKLTVSGTAHSKGTLTFEGTTALTIAAKAAQLSVDDNGLWVSERPLAKGEIRDLSGALGSTRYLSGPELALLQP